MTMSEESNSKQTFRITLTCQFHPRLISLLGEPKTTTKDKFFALARHLLDMHQGLGVSPAIQMEVEEVNPLQRSPSPTPLNTRALCSPSTMSATSRGMADLVESSWGSDWVDDGVEEKQPSF